MTSPNTLSKRFFVHKSGLFLLLLAFSIGIVPALVLIPRFLACNLPVGVVEGYVLGYDFREPGAGLTIFESCPDGSVLSTTTTDEIGHFIFHGSSSAVNQSYLISVNGAPAQLGNQLVKSDWGQWAGMVTTNSSAASSVTIILARAAVVRVPVVAMFSNSQYVSLSFSRTFGDAFNLGFNIENSSISTGFSTSFSDAGSWGFKASPALGSSQYIYDLFYAVTFWCNSGSFCTNRFGGVGIRSAGISTLVSGYLPSSDYAIEYINPGALPSNTDYANLPAAAGSGLGQNLTITGDTVLTSGNGLPSALKFSSYGIPLSMKVTVMVRTGTPLISYWIRNVGDSNLCFREYPNRNINSRETAAEFHIWQILC